MEYKIKIKSVLRRILEERKLSIKELAKQCGVSASTISTWLTTNGSPKSPEHVASVARCLGIPMHTLLFDMPEPTEASIEQAQTDVVLEGYYKLRLEKVILPKKG